MKNYSGNESNYNGWFEEWAAKALDRRLRLMSDEYELTEEELSKKKAVALKYDPAKNIAPKVVAKGKGHVAESILQAAQQNKIPVYQNKSLVNMLMALELDREIPAELYTTVAEGLAYVYRVDKKHKKSDLPPIKGL